MGDDQFDTTKYDPTEHTLRIAFRIGSSTIPNVLRRPETWFIVAVNIVVTFGTTKGFISIDRNLCPPTALSILSGLMTFFLIFYSNNCFARYFALHAKVRDMMGGLYDFCWECRLRLDYKNNRRRAMYYMLAGTLGFFHEATNGDLSGEEIAKLRARGLISGLEEIYLRDHFTAKAKSFLILHWCCETVTYGLRTQGTNNDRFIKMFQDKVYAIRRLHQDVVDTLKLPLPFQYFHVMNLMLLCTLFMMAIVDGTNTNYAGSIVFFLVLVAFMGIREVAMGMSDPFGDDDVDFPIDDWFNEVLHTCIHLLEFEYKVDKPTNFTAVEPLSARFPSSGEAVPDPYAKSYQELFPGGPASSSNGGK
eukprot:gnl/MRDRNA2_/MRDRNA2_115492_c0_seq1.p1 gnl/MRDRNA2_/MRDRNA2_115492_c0~~gnl/MRDRNA2_/MRDRNA2_115492_c0_seq1.p1  ORF type:complete len:362 (+),score=49.15 gnl/MRDRNA2_/MRDRNA2_115492_c0_seq1:98-1183(+)